MNSAKWFVFGLCFLSVMAGAAVYYVECKIAQVTAVVDGAVESVQDTAQAVVDAPMNAVSSFGNNFMTGMDAIGEAVSEVDWQEEFQAMDKAVTRAIGETFEFLISF